MTTATLPTRIQITELSSSAAETSYSNFSRSFPGFSSKSRRQMRIDWNLINNHISPHVLSEGDVNVRISTLEESVDMICAFKDRYSDELFSEEKEQIDYWLKALYLAIEINFSFWLVNKSAETYSDKFNEVIEAIKIIYENLEGYLGVLEYSFASETVNFIQNFLSEISTYKIDLFVKEKSLITLELREKFSFLKYQSSKLLSKTGNIAERAGLVKFQLDCETIYLSPDSAEGKAIQRLDSSDSDDWITVIEEGQEVDVHASLERLKKRGYKVKVSSAD